MWNTIVIISYKYLSFCEVHAYPSEFRVNSINEFVRHKRELARGLLLLMFLSYDCHPAIARFL